MTNKLYLTIITLTISLLPICAGNRMSFDRSLNLLQNPDDGSLKYVSSNNLQNDLSLTFR